MEKLQQAMEKARASRAARTGSTPRQTAQRARPADGSDWTGFAELSLDQALLARHRIFAHDGIHEATPYDLLRTRLRDLTKRNDTKRIAITSPFPKAGKSTLLSNLAMSLGRLPYQRTMVFDFDLRRPNLHNLLGHRPKSDMGQLINGDLDPTDHMLRHGDNLAFGLNKGPVRNSAELLQSDLTGDFLSRMESSFAPDLMLFDMPPFLVADDAHGFLSHVDGILLVVEAEKTTADQIERLEERIASLTNLIGVVLNKCQFPNDGARSDYDYGYKYGY